MKYSYYHWSKSIRKKTSFSKNARKGICRARHYPRWNKYTHRFKLKKNFDSDSNENAKEIKNKTWLEISPDEASQLTCEELARKVDVFFKTIG